MLALLRHPAAEGRPDELMFCFRRLVAQPGGLMFALHLVFTMDVSNFATILNMFANKTSQRYIGRFTDLTANLTNLQFSLNFCLFSLESVLLQRLLRTQSMPWRKFAKNDEYYNIYIFLKTKTKLGLLRNFLFYDDDHSYSVIIRSHRPHALRRSVLLRWWSFLQCDY